MFLFQKERERERAAFEAKQVPPTSAPKPVFVPKKQEEAKEPPLLIAEHYKKFEQTAKELQKLKDQVKDYKQKWREAAKRAEDLDSKRPSSIIRGPKKRVKEEIDDDLEKDPPKKRTKKERLDEDLKVIEKSLPQEAGKMKKVRKELEKTKEEKKKVKRQLVQDWEETSKATKKFEPQKEEPPAPTKEAPQKKEEPIKTN